MKALLRFVLAALVAASAFAQVPVNQSAVRIVGTAGAGYVSFNTTQSSAPAAPTAGFTEYADSAGQVSWRRASDGFVRSFASTLTANRTYTLPDASITLAGSASALTSGRVAFATTSGLLTDSSTFTYAAAGGTSGALAVNPTSTSTAGSIIATFSQTNTATSGTNYGLQILTTYNQTSGTAANTDLLVQRTSTAVGSGTQLLMNLLVGSTSYFRVLTSGDTHVNGTLYVDAGGAAITGDNNVTSGDMVTTTIGKTLKVKSGTNAKSGTFTLSSGTVTVSNTSVTANSVVGCTVKTSSGTLGTGTPEIVITAGTGFTATGVATDNSTYNFVITEVN